MHAEEWDASDIRLDQSINCWRIHAAQLPHTKVAPEEKEKCAEDAHAGELEAEVSCLFAVLAQSPSKGTHDRPRRPGVQKNICVANCHVSDGNCGETDDERPWTTQEHACKKGCDHDGFYIWDVLKEVTANCAKGNKQNCGDDLFL